MIEVAASAIATGRFGDSAARIPTVGATPRPGVSHTSEVVSAVHRAWALAGAHGPGRTPVRAWTGSDPGQGLGRTMAQGRLGPRTGPDPGPELGFSSKCSEQASRTFQEKR